MKCLQVTVTDNFLFLIQNHQQLAVTLYSDLNILGKSLTDQDFKFAF